MSVSMENQSSGPKAPSQSQNDRMVGNRAVNNRPPPPAVFHPPYPGMPPSRNGSASEHSASDHSSQGTVSMRHQQRAFRPPNKFHDVKDEGYRQRHQDKAMGGRKPSMTARQSKGGTFAPYYHPSHSDVRGSGPHSFESHQHVERRGEPSSRGEGDRRSDSDSQYPFPRDGPSPGRGYSYNAYSTAPPPHPNAAPAHSRRYGERPYMPPQPGSPPHRSNSMSSGNKRKSHDPETPEGPRLISNQSSDDSINALLPPKRARSNHAFSSESVLMKSFTPLSPIHSRTFSRDEAVDMSRFMDSRGSADGMGLFQSWSSGNSPPVDHSTMDVRFCYNAWQGGGVRRQGSRNWDDKMYKSKGDHDAHQQQRQYSSESRTPSGSGSGISPDRWQIPDQRQSSGPPPPPPSHSDHGGDPFFPNSYSTPPSSQYCQPLHPEDRYVPHDGHLSRRLPSYGRETESSDRPYWQGDSGSFRQCSVPRREEVEDGPKPTSSHPGAHTPPVGNGWGRYAPEEYPPHPYDRGMPQLRPPPYDGWGPRSYQDQPYCPPRSMPEPQSKEYIGYHAQNARIDYGIDGGATAMRTPNDVLLLSLPEDKISLSETLCIVRENIEVFVATEADVKAPAPGRKRPVVIGQVGLRCIHCRAATHQSEKVKRAVCFPSSIKRIYRTVIDMKLDHFKACRFVPIEFKMKLEQLRATNARSTGTTMQYFVQAAKRMGMSDGGHGIRFVKDSESKDSPNSKGIHPLITGQPVKGEPGRDRQPGESATSVVQSKPHEISSKRRSLASVPSGVSFSLSMDLSISGTSTGSSQKVHSSPNLDGVNDDIPYFTGKRILALSDDKCALSPLRCFLRENVYAFSATAEDIAVRTPTTFSVVEGQVGIGCIHCHHLPAKDRINRAVCFPFSIQRIYQSVADIQRFHLAECKMVPASVKEKFNQLQQASTKGSKGLATRQYWVSSAKKVGLVDTGNGIRFARDPNIPMEKAVSLDILAQVATDVTTASKPLVLPEDKSQIAGFIYRVMQQVQPCRFTEADRNKRRLKDVGCIGVECKHCAGQVDGRKFFWSSVNAVESNFVSVHTHMMECKMIPTELKDELAELKTLRKEHTAKLKTGSQKAFFSRVWGRLHAEGDNIPSISLSKENGEVCDVPPHVAVPSQTKRAPFLLGESSRSSDDGPTSSPSSSFSVHFKEEDLPPPLSDNQHHPLTSGHILASSPDSNKFPLLTMGVGSPESSPSSSSVESPSATKAQAPDEGHPLHVAM